MSHHPPHGHPPPYYYPAPGTHTPAPVPGAYTYVQTPVMMPVYQPQPPPPPPPHPEPVHPAQPTYVTNYIYQQPPQPQPIVIEEITIHSEPSNPWDNVKTTAEKGLATVGKGLAWLENSLQNLNTNSQVTQQSKTVTTTHRVLSPPTTCYLDAEKPFDWVPATTADVSALTHRAFVAGKEGWDSSPLCVIRAHHSGEFIPGKLAIKHRSAYVPHGGKEVPVHHFEVLCAPAHALRWLPSSNGQVPVGAIPAGNTHNGEPLYIARAKHLRSITPGKVHPSHGCCYIPFGGAEVSYKSYEVLCKIVG